MTSRRLLLLCHLAAFHLSVAGAQHLKSPSLYGAEAGVCGNDFHHSLLQEELAQFTDFRRKPAAAAALRRLRSEPVLIKLNLLYEPALAASFESRQHLERFLRNIVYTTQLIYEQPELSAHLKLQLVVVSVNELQLPLAPSDSSSDILRALTGASAAANLNPSADLNILLNFRTYHETHLAPGGKILGLAYTGSFCNHPLKTLVMVAHSYGSAYTMAHELAHSLGVHHDGSTASSISSKCTSSSYIMHPSSGGTLWSNCSVQEMLAHLSPLAECVYSRARLASATPVSEYFDFRRQTRNPSVLPGLDEPLDGQCQAAFRTRNAYSDFSRNGQNGMDADTCEMLTCSLEGQRLQQPVGPALPGSACADARGRRGTCYEAWCRREAH